MSSDHQSKLLEIAQQIQHLTASITDHLSNSNLNEPNFTPASTDVPSDPQYNALRDQLNDAANDLLHLVNGPRTHLRRFLCTHNDLSAYQVAFDFDLFMALPEDQDIGLPELAAKTGLNEEFLARILRFLCTQRVFMEASPGRFVHTHASSLVSRDADLRAAGGYQLDEMFKAASDTATCLHKRAEDTQKSSLSPFEERHGSSLFKFYAENPRLGRRFAAAMAGITKLDRQLDELREGFAWNELGDRKLVDVGGGSGHISVALARSIPNLHVVVQDSNPGMLAAGKMQSLEGLEERVTFMQHNFFTPQPITDAGVYLLRQVLHNWSDSDCVQILKSFVSTLEKCRPSTPILINDSIIPAANTVSKFEEHGLRQMDMMMFVALGAKQRSKVEFEQIIKDADPRFEIVKVYSKGSMGLLEVHLICKE